MVYIAVSLILRDSERMLIMLYDDFNGKGDQGEEKDQTGAF